MPDLLSGVLATPGLIWLTLTMLVAGLVRGFTGFGTALVFLPVGTLFLPLPQAVLVLCVVDLIALPVILPRAWPSAQKREVGLLALAAFVGAPLGVALLRLLDATSLRWGVAAVASLTLAALVSGWRYRRRVGRAGLLTIGGLSGVLGGSTGLAGPPVILFYLAGQAGVAAVRANVILFLAAIDVLITANLVLSGLVDGVSFWLALALVAPYAAGLAAGQALFRPERERAFRGLAYVVIAASILSGLPLFD